MSHEERPEPRPGQPRVVKKVVKRTVVRPATSQRSSTQRSSTQRSSAQRSSAARTSRPAGAKATVETRPTPGQSPRRPAIDLGRVRQTGRQWTRRSGQGASAGLAGVRRAGRAGVGFVSDRYWDVRAYRLPPQPPLRSSLVVGLLLGLFAVGVGWLSGIVFSMTRGTTSGGGLWGGLVVVTLAVFSVWAGARLLRALRVDNAGTVSLLAVFLVLIAVLMFFVDLAAGPWAVLILPALAAASYAVAHVLTALATDEPKDAE